MKRTLFCIIILFPIYIFSQIPFTQLGQDIDGEAAGDFSGQSVSMNAAGDRVAIGAPNNDGNGFSAGHVRIYEYNGNNWFQLGSDINGEASGDQFGFSVSMNAPGNRIAVGAPYNDGSGTDAGQVKIYEYNGSNWVQVGGNINGESPYDNCGFSVSFNAIGDKLAIGSPGDTWYPTVYYSGKVSIYSYNGFFWSVLGTKILAGTPQTNTWENRFGVSVALDGLGNRVVIGASETAYYANTQGGCGSYSYNRCKAGSATLYEFTTNDWQRISSIRGVGEYVNSQSGNGNVGDNLGYSVDISYGGDTIVVGIPRANPVTGSNNNIIYGTGLARVYDSNFQQIGTDINGLTSNDKCGYSVSINNSGSTIAIGSYNSNSAGTSRGITNIFKYNNNNWNLESLHYGEADYDLFGKSVSINGKGTKIVIGGPQNDGNGVDAGHTRVFSCQPSYSTDVQTACGSYTWIDGNTYTTNNNIATYYLLSSSGCDSIVTLDLTIHNTSSTNTSQTACDSYTASNGQTFTSSGTYTLNLQTIHGCDSTVNLNLTINNSTSTTDTQVACDSYTWLDGNTYTSSNNSAQHITTNSVGCNHTTTLDLIINNSTTSIQNVSHCGNSFMMNGQIYSQNGTYIQTINNSAGCDSTINLNLTLNNNHFNVNFNTTQQVYLQPPFFVSLINATPNINDFNFTWDFGDGSSVDSNSQTINHLYNYNGLYNVTLFATNKNTGCLDSLFQNEFIYCAGGVDNPNGIVEQHASDVTIYPNPTADYITLEVKHYQGPMEVILYDINGKILITQTTNKVNLENLPSGVYQMVVKYGEKQQGMRVLKN